MKLSFAKWPVLALLLLTPALADAQAYVRTPAGPGTIIESGMTPPSLGCFASTGALASPAAATSSTAATVTGTTSTSAQLMAGLAFAVTPACTGNLLVTVSGDLSNGTISDGCIIQIRYGTGTAPTNGAAAAGVSVGSPVKAISTAAAAKMPFSTSWVVSSLTVGTAYWVDLGEEAITGGTCTIENVNTTVSEL